MMSAGFPWGVKAPDNAPENASIPTFTSLHTTVPRYTPSFASLDKESENEVSNFNQKKRRHDEDIHITPNSTSPRRKVYPNSRFKKPKTPKIIGQTLPVNRLVEVLDHKSLQNLLSELIQCHPEIASTVNKLSPKPSINNSLELIKEKFDEIFTHLPYKCDTESDYSYLRVKPYFMEFLNCLSDFILNYLPPIELNTRNSLGFLDTVTQLMHDLPNFSNTEFQYTKNMAYEQISNTWFIIISGKIYWDDQSEPPIQGSGPALGELECIEDSASSAENVIKLVKIAKSLDLQKSLEKHNEQTQGKFVGVIEFLKSQESQFEIFNAQSTGSTGAASGVLSDLITVDYSNFSISH